MSTPGARPAEEARARLPGGRSLAFAVAGGQAVWALALLVAYPTVQVACAADLPILVHLVRWIAMVVALGATVTGGRAWRAAHAAGAMAPGEHGDPASPDEPPRAFATGWRRHAQRVAFLGFAGMLLSGIAVFLLFVEDLGTWVIDPCISG